MDDDDLIARIYPFDESRRLEQLRHATASIKCNRRSRPPLYSPAPPLTQQPPRDGREATEPLEGDTNAYGKQDLSSLPFLELKFSDGPRASAGFVFGKDPDASDIVLPNLPGISRQHFAVTYKNTFADGRYRLVVRDLGSSVGTTVTYDAQGEHRRRKFDWIIAGFECPDLAKTIIVQVHKHIRFQIVLAPHDLTSPTYISNVERFLQGARPDTLVGALRLQRAPHTEWNAAAHTPSDGPILVNRGIISQGTFGVVSRRWNVSTGEEYGCKKPADPKYHREDWLKEIFIMKRVDHEHIVRLCFSQTTPEPRLYLEYMPCGNLLVESRREPFTFTECAHILRQSLSALVYLHGQREPIAHRDLKPQNILVQCRKPLHVKLADFGLAKAGDLLTHCGTLSYAPPELQLDSRSRRHTVAVDVWSLGVVILQFMYGLPSPGHGEKLVWCVAIVEAAISRELDGLTEILRGMLRLQADMRYSAAKCLGLVEALCGSNQLVGVRTVQEDGSMPWPHGPTPYQDVTRASSPSAGSVHAIDDQTFILERKSTRSRRNARSGAPLPAVRHPAQPPRQDSKSHVREHLPATGRIQKRHRQHSRAADSPGRDYNLRSSSNSRTRGALLGLVQGLDRAVPATAEQADDKPNSPVAPSAALANGLVRPSATWSRTVLFDRPGLARMVVRCCSISMRTSDHWLNASEIILASDLPEWKRRRCLDELNRRGFRAEVNLPIWVPFRDGVFVCQAAGLEGELEPLLSVPGLARPAPEENYLLFLREQEQPDDRIEVFDAGSCTVAYQPGRRRINATNLCKLYGIKRRSLSRFFCEHPHMAKQTRLGGPTHLRGSYISYEDARIFLLHFKVDDGLLDRWIGYTSPGPSNDNLGHDPATATATPLPAASNVSHPASPLMAASSVSHAASPIPVPVRVSHPPNDAGELAKESAYTQISHYTEPSYSNGSYLAAMNGSSRLEPKNLRSLLTAPTTEDLEPPGLRSGLGLSDGGGSGRWLAAFECG